MAAGQVTKLKNQWHDIADKLLTQQATAELAVGIIDILGDFADLDPDDEVTIVLNEVTGLQVEQAEAAITPELLTTERVVNSIAYGLFHGGMDLADFDDAELNARDENGLAFTTRDGSYFEVTVRKVR